MTVALERIENPQMVEVHVSGPEGANRLYIFGGIGVFRWLHSTDDFWEGWVDEAVRISMLGISGAPRMFEDQVVSHVETAALASFSFSETRRNDTWGFAVDSLDAFFTADHELSFADFGINVQLAMRGYEARMFRISFQMNVVARL